MTKWAVQTVDYYEQECYRDSIEMDIRLFDTKLEAVEELNRIIRDDWTTEVDVDGDVRMLADCPGKSEMESEKYSSWYYSEYGTWAWAFNSSGGHKGEVFEIEVDD